MEQEKKTCSRCRSTKEISHFQTINGSLRVIVSSVENIFPQKEDDQILNRLILNRIQISVNLKSPN